MMISLKTLIDSVRGVQPEAEISVELPFSGQTVSGHPFGVMKGANAIGEIDAHISIGGHGLGGWGIPVHEIPLWLNFFTPEKGTKLEPKVGWAMRLIYDKECPQERYFLTTWGCSVVAALSVDDLKEIRLALQAIQSLAVELESEKPNPRHRAKPYDLPKKYW